MKIINKIGIVIFLFIVIVVLAVFMKIFLFASFRVSTHSMEPTIMSGDHIIVNKLILGARIYEKRGKGDVKIKMKRIRGLRNVKRNDVLVFDFPYKKYAPNKIIQGGNLFYVKRCVAIPGDTFYIDSGFYKVKGINENLGYAECQQELSRMKEVPLNKRLQYVFPKDTTYYQWTIKDFGPLYIPAKGDDLEIDSVSVQLYKNLIEYETNKSISIKNGIVHLSDSSIYNYTFRQNYYFVVGDFLFDS